MILSLFDRDAASLQGFLHRQNLFLLRGDDGRGQLLNLRAVGALEDSLGHRHSSLMVGDHELEEKDVHILSRSSLKGIYLFRRRHSRHPILGGVAHPGHMRFGPGSREAPDLEPSPHLADLGLLIEEDIGGQHLNVLTLGAATHDIGHLDGLGMVDHHVPDEPYLRRILARRH